MEIAADQMTIVGGSVSKSSDIVNILCCGNLDASQGGQCRVIKLAARVRKNGVRVFGSGNGAGLRESCSSDVPFLSAQEIGWTAGSSMPPSWVLILREGRGKSRVGGEKWQEVMFLREAMRLVLFGLFAD